MTVLPDLGEGAATEKSSPELKRAPLSYESRHGQLPEGRFLKVLQLPDEAEIHKTKKED